VAPEDFDRFVASLVQTFGGPTTKQETIVRRVAIREHNREEYLYEAERDRQTNDRKVATRSFAPFLA